MAPPPRQVLLFSGHMADAPGRTPPRLPSAHLPAAAAAIEQLLDELQAGPEDLALTQGAAGGDLLFAEACQRRGVPLQLLLPQAEEAFVADSILPSEQGPAWLARWQALRERQPAPPQVLPPGAGNPYERCNRWLLETALAHGAERLRLICLWDGAEGGAGGTGHMVQAVQRVAGRVFWIDTRRLAP